MKYKGNTEQYYISYRKKFGRRLMNEMLKKDVNAYDIARAIGISANSVYRYCRGEQAPDASVVYRICGYLGLTPNYLLGMEESKMIEIKMILEDGATAPTQAHEGDAYDMYALEETTAMPHTTTKVRTGVHMQIPVGYFGDMRPRSSVFIRGLDVAGTIDPTYTGEIMVLVRNNTDDYMFIHKGDRVGQMAIVPCACNAVFNIVDSLYETERGNGGFGSTGV